MEVRTLTTKKGKKVETTFSDEAAIQVLRDASDVDPDTLEDTGRRKLSSFGRDLLRKYDRYGLSHDQMVWVHALAVERFTERSDPEPEEQGAHESVVKYLAHAREHGLKYPKIRLTTIEDRRVVLSLAGSRSRQPGTVNVTDGGPYGENTWYGRIGTDGTLEPGRALTADVRELLAEFAGAPGETAKAQGQLTGRCCFCGRDLETRESVGAGYGPVCAEKWGLPWGASTAAQYEKRKARAVAPSYGNNEDAGDLDAENAAGYSEAVSEGSFDPVDGLTDHEFESIMRDHGGC
jgi:hypothetical protein